MPSPAETNARRHANPAAPTASDALTPEAQMRVTKEFFVSSARGLRQSPEFVFDLSPIVVQRRAEACLGHLVRAAEAQAEKPVFFVFAHEALPQVGHLAWRQLLEVGRDDLVAKSARPGAKWRVSKQLPREKTIDYAVGKGIEELERVHDICNGNGIDPKEKARRNDRVFGGRKLVRSKPGITVELRATHAAIAGWGAEAPMALQLILPDLSSAIAVAEQAIPKSAGRHASPWAWSDEVLESAVALALILGALREHAIATGTLQMRELMKRIITPETAEAGAAEDSEEEPADGDAPAEQGGVDAGATTAATTEAAEPNPDAPRP